MKNRKGKKFRVLVCAFACVKDPDTRFGFGGGGETSLGWNVALQLARFYQLSVITDLGNKPAIEKALLQNPLPNVHFYYIGLPAFLGFTKRWIQIYTYLWQIKSYFFVKKLHTKNPFDVFQHVTYANDWMASFIGALLPIPYIRGPGGGAHRVPKSFLVNYSFKERLAQWVRSAGQWVFRHDPFFIMGQNRARVILVCNREAFDALPKKWQKKASFFPVNGISKEDLALFNSQQEKRIGPFLLLSAGKFIKIKGFDLAIRAFKVFIDKVADAKLVIIGDGPELQHLKNLIGRLHLEKNVFLEAWLPRPSLLRKMIDSDVFIFPSLRDGGGNVVVEAMAQGKPIICFDMAGPGFHVNETCGIKIPPENPSQAIGDMAAAMEKLYYNEVLRSALGSGARKRAEGFYAWDILREKLKNIYESAVKN